MNTDSVKILCCKYRLSPTKAQVTALDTMLDTLRLAYNSLLNERKFLYETTGKGISKGISQYGQEKHFADWRKPFPELIDVHSHLLQNVALRVNLVFTAFFRRVKAGETPGYPRFKGGGQDDSFCFKEWGNKNKNNKSNLTRMLHIFTERTWHYLTSQDCHACGYRAKKKLSERWHLCPMCGASLDRDTNAAINILQLATG